LETTSEWKERKTHESSPSFRNRLEGGGSVLLELEVVVESSLFRRYEDAKDQDSR